MSARAHCGVNGGLVIMCDMHRWRTIHLLPAFICMTHICLHNYSGLIINPMYLFCVGAQPENLAKWQHSTLPFLLLINISWPLCKQVMGNLAPEFFLVPCRCYNCTVKVLSPTWLKHWISVCCCFICLFVLWGWRFEDVAAADVENMTASIFLIKTCSKDNSLI